MDPNPVFLRPTDTVITAALYIMRHRYRNLPVVDECGCYLGIFGVNCLLKQVLPKAAVMDHGLEDVSFVQDTLADLHNRLREVEDKPVTICMNTEIATVPPDLPLVETLLILYRTRTSVPVVAPGTCELLGMISYWDVGEKILSA